ncbi:MAG TPA: DUF1840 domain-containing protein [Rhodocyclaceae bacterium]
MLVSFESSTDGQLQMFADVAAPLLRYLRKTPAPRGVITAEELPELLAALQRLRDGSDRAAPLDGDAHAAADLDANEIPVSLRQRVAPLIELMQRTMGNEGYLMWRAPPDFGSENSGRR